jgi:mono/diheme cytochrome c family protein
MMGDAVATGMAGHELEFLERLLKLPPAEDAEMAPTGIIPTLAACVMKERRGSRVAALLDLAATQPDERQCVLFTALAGKAPAKGAPAPNPIRLSAEPKSFLALKAKATSGALKPLLARIDTQIVWPNKPGAKPFATPIPLTVEQQALFTKGKAIYAAVCIACHQPTGSGLANLAPPLANSEWLLGPSDVPIRVVLNGLTGPISVGGTKWQLEMPGLGVFSDEDIASVLTYVRREWENGGVPISPAEVAHVRALTQGRAKAWSAEELKKPLGTEQKAK